MDVVQQKQAPVHINSHKAQNLFLFLNALHKSKACVEVHKVTQDDSESHYEQIGAFFASQCYVLRIPIVCCSDLHQSRCYNPSLYERCQRPFEVSEERRVIECADVCLFVVPLRQGQVVRDLFPVAVHIVVC
jgi:hypothetical protein